MAAQSKRLRTAAAAVALLLLLAGFAPASASEGAEALEPLRALGVEPLESQLPAAEFTLPGLDGGEVSLGDFKERFVLLHFWATWSPSASVDLVNLEKLQNALGEKPFAVVAIAVDLLGKPQVEAFLKTHPTAVPVVTDPRGETLLRYEVKVVPTTVLVDGQGRVVARAVGSRQWGESAAIKALKKVVKGPDHYGIITSGLPPPPTERSR